MLTQLLEFTVTADHVALVRRLSIDWNDGAYDGAPTVNEKRPYGQTGAALCVAEILGWDFDEVAGLTPEQEAAALRLHRETALALQIILREGSFAPGRYRRGHVLGAWKRGDDA